MLAIVLKKNLIVNQSIMKYLTIEIKSYEYKIKTNFYEKGIPKEVSHCIYLSVILIDSVYSQVFLEEFKYIANTFKYKEKGFINDDLEISSNDSDEEAPGESDERASDEEQIKTKYLDCLLQGAILYRRFCSFCTILKKRLLKTVGYRSLVTDPSKNMNKKSVLEVFWIVQLQLRKRAVLLKVEAHLPNQVFC